MLPLSTLNRMEYIGSIPFAANSTGNLATNGGLLPNDRFYHSLLLEFRGRLTMPAATGPSAVQADAHAAILERIQVEGFHKIRRNQERFIDMRGADLELLQRLYLPSNLVKTPTSISVAASANNDIVCQILVPFIPLRMPPAVQTGFLLDSPNYDSLKLNVQFGDFKSVVVPGATDATMTAYGSGFGVPEVRVYGLFAMQSNLFARFVPGRLFRYSQEITGSIPTTTANDVRLLDLPRGFDIRTVALKTGTKATNTTAGNNSYATLTEFLDDIRINQGLGKYIRRVLNNDALYADLGMGYNLPARITGLGVFDFAPNGMPSEVLSTRRLIQGPTGNTDLYLSANVTGAANQAVNVLLEEWRSRPAMV